MLAEQRQLSERPRSHWDGNQLWRHQFKNLPRQAERQEEGEWQLQLIRSQGVDRASCSEKSLLPLAVAAEGHYVY